MKSFAPCLTNHSTYRMAMFVEQRTYTLLPGRGPEYVALYQQEGLHVQTRHLPKMLGWFLSEIGELNQIVHMWGYDDLVHRAECRERLLKDAEWRAVLPKLLALIDRMETKILVPASFSPIR